MAEKENTEENKDYICKSVFKNGESTTSKNRFTNIWIEMINRIEKGKYVNYLR